jgi:hypothetical protein
MELRNEGLTMKRTLIVLATTLLLAGPSAAGISPSLPKGCPLRFDQPTTGLARTCLFVGRFNTREGSLVAAFAGNGSAVVVAIGDGNAKPLLFLPATVDGPTTGTLQRWQAEDSASGSTGTLTLEDGGRRLRVRAALPDGQAGPPAEFVGYFADMVDAGEAVAAR